jgi:hypothetical protein
MDFLILSSAHLLVRLIQYLFFAVVEFKLSLKHLIFQCRQEKLDLKHYIDGGVPLWKNRLFCLTITNICL